MRSPTRSDRLFSLVPGSVRHFSLLWSVCPFGGSRAPLRRTSQARRGSPAKGGMRRLFWAALSEKALQKRGSPLSCESKKREKPPPWRTVPFGPGRRRGGIAAEESNLCGRDGSERKQRQNSRRLFVSLAAPAASNGSIRIICLLLRSRKKSRKAIFCTSGPVTPPGARRRCIWTSFLLRSNKKRPQQSGGYFFGHVASPLATAIGINLFYCEAIKNGWRPPSIFITSFYTSAPPARTQRSGPAPALPAPRQTPSPAKTAPGPLSPAKAPKKRSGTRAAAAASPLS